MISTERFIYIHQPKTGGTFVSSVLIELIDLLRTTELRVRRIENVFVKTKFKHAACRHIPRAHRRKQVLTTMRNPYDIYVSEYEFGWWTLLKLKNDNLDCQKIHTGIPNIHFLRTESLNQDLFEYLYNLGYSRDRLEFILERGKVLPGGKGRTAEQKWQSYYTPEFFAHIRQRERFLFNLFPEYDRPLNDCDLSNQTGVVYS